MQLTFLGSGDAFGSGGRFQSCFLLRHGERGILLECGATSLPAMKRAGVDPSLVDAVVVSHLHGDHFGGLPFLILDAQFSRRTRPLVVAGPPGLAARLRDAMEVLFPGSSTVERKFAVVPIELPERVPTPVADASVTAYPVVHPSGAPAFALRLTLGERVIAYSGDTEWTDTLVEAAHAADVFVCEAYHVDRHVRFHLDYRTLVAHRDALQCRRLILTHLGQDALARRDEIDAEVAHDGLVVEV